MRRAFTLVEVLVATALSLLLLLVMSHSFRYLTRAQSKATTQLERARGIEELFRRLDLDWARMVSLEDEEWEFFLGESGTRPRRDHLQLMVLEPHPRRDGLLRRVWVTYAIVGRRDLLDWEPQPGQAPPAPDPDDVRVVVRTWRLLDGGERGDAASEDASGQTMVLIRDARELGFELVRPNLAPGTLGPPYTEEDFVLVDQGATVEGFRLILQHPRPCLRPGTQVRLTDSTTSSEHDSHLLDSIFVIRARVGTGDTEFLLDSAPGNAERVRVEAAWLPTTLQATVELADNTAREASRGDNRQPTSAELAEDQDETSRRAGSTPLSRRPPRHQRVFFRRDGDGLTMSR